MRRAILVSALVFGLLMPIPYATAVLPNPWADRGPLVIAHQGGSHEGPSNTLFAFKTAMAGGADVIEMDVQATSDRRIVVIHDYTVNRTTGSEGFVRAKTLDELEALDAAFCWKPGVNSCAPGVPASDYPYRGVATGDKPPPPGFEVNDFRIPTLDEVLQAMSEFESTNNRRVGLFIEIKYLEPDPNKPQPLSAVVESIPFEAEVAQLLSQARRTADDTILSSFDDGSNERMRAAASAIGLDLSFATGTGATAAFWASSQGPLPGAPDPLYQVLAVPEVFQGQRVVDEGGDFISDAKANNFAVHVWTINSEADMVRLLAMEVDGILTDRPSLLREIIHGIEVQVDVRPGADRAVIRTSSKTMIPVAVLSTSSFDATRVDPGSICFGDADSPDERDCTEAHGAGHWADVDEDGDIDLLLHYEASETGIDSGDRSACLHGLTTDGRKIYGCDAIETRG